MKGTERLFYYIKKSPIYMVFSLICALFYVVSMVLVPLINGKMVDVIKLMLDEGSVNSNLDSLIRFMIIDGILIILVVIFEFLFDYLVNVFVEKITKNIKDDIFEKLNSVSIRYIDSHPHGDLVSRCISDTENINNALISGFKQFYQGVIQIVATLIIMFIYNWILGLCVVILTPLSFLFSYFIAKNSKKYFKQQSSVQGNLGALTLEDFNNIFVLKSFNYDKDRFEEYQKVNDKLYDCGRKAQFFGSLTNPSTRLINNITYVTVGVIASLLCVFTKNSDYLFFGASCTVGTILVFIQYSTQFAKPFNEISSCLTEIQTGISSFKRVNDVLNEKDDIDEGKLDIEGTIKTLEFKNVKFNYEPNQKLIENLNLKVDYGQKIAIVGPTGCGKTTIINLILRFYDVVDGEILINGINIKEIKKSALRDEFGMILQDTWIFHGTVLENIKYAKQDATMEEVELAASRANALNFIKHLPKGFDTEISENSGLSVGEKQLICIARVMLVNRNLFILDEATSNIDTRAEMKIAQAFNKLVEGKTSFMIAHRLSTIVNSDAIIVMNSGHIEEIGKHYELLNNKGFYYNLFNAQYEN